MLTIANPVNAAQQKAVETAMKTLKVPSKKKHEGPYNAELLTQIDKGEEAAKRGGGMKINMADLWK